MAFTCLPHWGLLPKSAESLFAECGKATLFFSLDGFRNLATTALDADQSIMLACVIEGGGTVKTPLHPVGVAANDFRRRPWYNLTVELALGKHY